jgi:hypothetical protein
MPKPTIFTLHTPNKTIETSSKNYQQKNGTKNGRGHLNTEKPNYSLQIYPQHPSLFSNKTGTHLAKLSDGLLATALSTDTTIL